MSDSLVRRHGLEPLLAELSGSRPADPGVSVTIRSDLGHINVRGRSSDAGFVQPVGKVLGQPLPTEPNTVSSDRHQVFWLGPDEWLIVTPAAGVADLAGQLQQATSDTHASVNDISGGQIALGAMYPIKCVVAVANDEHNSLAMLQRRSGETLQQLLERLDAAIDLAWTANQFTDEFNAPLRRTKPR